MVVETVKYFSHSWFARLQCSTIKISGNICELPQRSHSCFSTHSSGPGAATFGSSDVWWEQNFVCWPFHPEGEKGVRVVHWGKIDTAENWLLKCFSEVIVRYIALCTVFMSRVTDGRSEIQSKLICSDPREELTPHWDWDLSTPGSQRLIFTLTLCSFAAQLSLVIIWPAEFSPFKTT